MFSCSFTWRVVTDLRFILILAIVGVFGCTEDRGAALRTLAPGLKPAMARHLAADDDSTFARYGIEVGVKELLDARLALRRALSFETPEDYARTVTALMPYIGRISERLAGDYGCFEYLRDDLFWMGLPANSAVELGRREAELNDIYLDRDLLLFEKANRIRELTGLFQDAGYWTGTVVAEYAVAEFMGALGQEEERRHNLRTALRLARREDLTLMISQILGVMGALHRESGELDSMAMRWNEAVNIASRHRLPEQAAMIASLYAHHYAEQGQLALAGDLYQEAQRICREFKGGYLELPFIIEAIFFHAELGYWGVVDQLLQQARVLLREYEESPRVVDRKVQTLRLNEVEARYLMAQGEVAAAEEIFTQLEDDIRALAYRLDYPHLLFAWAAGLLDNGVPAAALPVIGRGLVHSLASSLPVTRARFMALLARALRELGNDRAAMESLDQFRQLAAELGADGEQALREEWIDHDACRARLLLTRGLRAEGTAVLRAGLERLRGYLADTDASAQGYMFLDASDDLRLALHEYLGDDALARYELEMAWRRLRTILGENQRRAGGVTISFSVRAAGGRADRAWMRAQDDPVAYMIRLLLGPIDRGADGLPFLAQLAAHAAVHCLYYETPREIVRWIAQPGVVRCDTLSVSPGWVRDRVTIALAGMSRDPGDPEAPVDAELRGILRELTDAVLPREVTAVHSSDKPRLLLISPGGALGLLPFEALNTGHVQDYVPLLAQCDVAYLRFADPAPSGRASGQGVILADPQPPSALRRRYPLLADLGEGLIEAEIVTAALPDSWILRREAATKERLFELWEDAPFIYIAAHFVRDPEAPYLTYLPMSRSEEHRPLDASYLGIADIRSADLSRCRLAVLSGCASGAPYAGAASPAPGLGDAFLDAGVSVVIQTFWQVRDEEAARLMRGFVEEWAVKGETPLIAISRARRAYLQGRTGVRHPFTWASYSIKLGRL